MEPGRPSCGGQRACLDLRHYCVVELHRETDPHWFTERAKSAPAAQAAPQPPPLLCPNHYSTRALRETMGLVILFLSVLSLILRYSFMYIKRDRPNKGLGLGGSWV